MDVILCMEKREENLFCKDINIEVERIYILILRPFSNEDALTSGPIHKAREKEKLYSRRSTLGIENCKADRRNKIWRKHARL